MKPILFSTPMVQAILDGRKTQTRRVIKHTGNSMHYGKLLCDWGLSEKPYMKDGLLYWELQTAVDDSWVFEIKPKYQPGDILWVRETWGHIAHPNYNQGGYDEWFVYKASKQGELPEDFKWRPSIHMPREAARIFLKVTNIRVEKVQDITEDDVIAEGMNAGICQNCGKNSYPEPCGCENPQPEYIGAFAYLWNIINKKRGYGWSKNPWVWVIEFERVEKP